MGSRSAGGSRDFAWSLAYGAVSGTVSSVALQPLDVLKTRAQASAMSPASAVGGRLGLHRLGMNLIHQEGVQVLWRGTLPSLLRTVPGLALYLATVHRLHAAMSGNGSAVTPAQSAAQAALVAAVARTATAVALQPLVTLKTNIEAGGRCPSGLLDAALWLWRGGGGTHAFYRGLAATLARDVPYSSIYYAVYTRAKALLLPVPGCKNDGGGFDRLLRLGTASVCGSVVATVATHPADVVKTRRQLLSGAGGAWQAPSLRHLLDGIRAAEGSLTIGLLRGLTPRLLRRLGFATISWVTFEELHRLRLRRSEDS